MAEDQGTKSKKNISHNQLYGKRIKFENASGSAEYSNVNQHQRLPMQACENVIIKLDDDDNDDGCCVIAEIPRRKKMGSSLTDQTLRENASLKTNSNCKTTELQNRTFTFNMDKDKDIETIKFVNHNSGRISENAANKKLKIFCTQRSSITNSKTAKVKQSFRNHLRRKLNFLQECYRFNEKQQYIELLKSQASCNLLKPSQSKHKQLPFAKAVPVIDLTNDNDICSKQITKTSPSIKYTISESHKQDEDIQIIEVVPRIRSFEDVQKIRPVTTRHSVLKREIVLPSLDTSEAVLCLENSDYEARNLLIRKKTSSQETLEGQLRTLMQITEPKKEVSKASEQYFLPDLSSEQEKKIQNALMRDPSHEVLVESFGIKITRRDIQTLKGLNWLNDEVINFYMNLIVVRSKENECLPKVYAFNTFFFTKLVTNGYQSLRRWTKQVDIFSYDIILVPIHLGMHWCMSVIDFRSKFVKYYDSVGSPNNMCLEQLLLYLRSESLDKKQRSFSTDQWSKVNVDDIPQQMNGSDCGIFSCMFAEHLARDAAILFTQDDMPYFRNKMILEILNKKLIT